jgi:hypothetical protein
MKPMLQNFSKNIVSHVEQDDWFQVDLVFFLPIFENQGDSTLGDSFGEFPFVIDFFLSSWPSMFHYSL